ncbi:MAG: NrsF family protein [bacterium]|nr:NrsF family protein [bacterium]
MDKFIKDLCQANPKCQVLWPWWKRLVFWSLFVCGGLAFVLWFFRAELSITHGTNSLAILLEFMFMVATGVMAIYAVFNLCVPGRSLFLSSKLMLLPFFAWAFTLFGRLGYEAVTMPARVLSGASIQLGWGCSAEIVVLAILPGLALAFLVRRAMAIRTLCVSFFTFLSALVVGASIVHVTCPITVSLHMLLWHFLPVAVVSILGVKFSSCFRCSDQS